MLNEEKKQLNTVPLSAEELLRLLQERNIIDPDVIQDLTAEVSIEKQITEIHPHKIWKAKNGRWTTYIRDEQLPKNRRLISSKKKRKLFERLMEFYFPDQKLTGEATIRNLYPKWLEHKSLMVLETYVPRIQSDWKKYYENDPIVDIPIRYLNKIQLENWVLHLIRDNNMTRTNYYNASLIIRQIFQYAYDADLIQDNTFDRVTKKLSKLFKKVRKPPDETQIYQNEEIQALEKEIWEDFRKKGRKVYRLAPLAVLFQLYTGMRVSEVCALKYSDILPSGKIHVQRMLVKDTGKVRERTKGYEGEREVYLSEKAKTIIDATIDFRKTHHINCAEFIFSTTEIPFPERTINEYLQRYCERVDIPYRSSHKLRKTALSSMVNAGVSLNTVRSFAGHVDEKTTLRYYTFDRESEAVRNEQMEKALSFKSQKEDQ